jgi:hypothetical protein
MLLIETQNDKQAELLLKANLLESYPIQVERHVFLNSSEAVINTSSLDIMSDDETQTALADQSVSGAYRLMGKRDGRPFPLRTIFLTYGVLSLPSYIIYVTYESVSVHPYILNPMLCFQCQKFGHIQQ